MISFYWDAYLSIISSSSMSSHVFRKINIAKTQQNGWDKSTMDVSTELLLSIWVLFHSFPALSSVSQLTPTTCIYMYLSVNLFINLFIYRSVFLSNYLSSHLWKEISLSINRSTWLSTFLLVFVWDAVFFFLCSNRAYEILLYLTFSKILSRTFSKKLAKSNAKSVTLWQKTKY